MICRTLTIENLATGETLEEEADVVVSARGNLNDYKMPNIPGFETFSGQSMHSAAWNHE
jgi:cation diffusion facilitator CzcD-associated flavoprotein CzcO